MKNTMYRDCTGKRALLSSSEPIQKVGKRALGFEFENGVFVGNVWTRFLPKGLIIWGAPDGATLSTAVICNVNCARASYVGIPVKFFGHWKSFAEIARDWDAGLEPPGWCTWSAVMPGQTFRMGITDSKSKPLGPKEGVEICMWGLSEEF